MAGGCNVHVVHEPARGWIFDLAKAGLHLSGLEPKAPAQELKKIWSRFLKISERGRFLDFLPTKGTLKVKNAFVEVKQEERNRIEVVSIAGATYIPLRLCYRATHYISERDFVPLLDVKSRKICDSKIEILKPDPKAPFFDHALFSPTYKSSIREHLVRYLRGD
jgi:hypothetical protein